MVVVVVVVVVTEVVLAVAVAVTGNCEVQNATAAAFVDNGSKTL
jgi:hypothetical protein